MVGVEPSDIRKWTAIIESVGGINLSQGNCFVESDDDYVGLAGNVQSAILRGAHQTGYNTYTPATGVDDLKLAIAKKSEEFNKITVNPHPTEGNLTVTQGATGGLVCILHAIADPGDEVILLEPFYNYHLRALQMHGLTPRFSRMQGPTWALDYDEIESLISTRTKALIISTPNNPTGKVFSIEELTHLCEICHRHGIFLICDEVYEFITFDGTTHVSPASLPGAESCVITVSAFSKTLAITGWRLGYVITPPALPELAQRVRIANEMLFVCAPSPLQRAIAPVVADWQPFLRLSKKYQRKRDALCHALDGAGLKHERPHGAYYVLADCSGFGLPSDVDINMMLVKSYGFAGVPGVAFYHDEATTGTIRFCFAVMDTELSRLGSRLGKVSS
jgi:aminotransferase